MNPFNNEELITQRHRLIELPQQFQKQYAGGYHLDITTEYQPPLEIEDAFLIKMRSIIENRLDDVGYNIPQFCRDAGMSRTQLHRKLKALTGKSATIFIRSIRLQKAKELLKSTNLNVSEIAYEVGFRDPSYFSTSFLEEFGTSPSESRK